MAKKRKNDTRLDPFATPVEGSSLDDLLDQAKIGDVITMPAPSDPLRTITLTCQVIKPADIEKITQVYGQNRREQTLLNEKSVADILPAIKHDKRNLHPALCWQKEGQQWVLSGSRRRKACMLAEADYVVLSSADFNDADAKALAISSDQYIAPSLWELGQAYNATKRSLITQGLKGSYREIANIEGISHTAVADAIKAYEIIPKHVLSLYPTPNHLGREAAKKLISAIKENQTAFDKQIATFNEQLFVNDEQSDEKRAILITQFLTTFGDKANRSEALLENKYVKLQRNIKSGDVTIKIDNKVLTDKRLEQLQKLLAAYN
ncbi:chromosome partitioning protein, ParB family [Pseudoalteromonas citrea]|uniref:Chromosome partitioning protein, ParB family n=2 Tax=Pseudoalteromonas citrea TaxID=43655 RepID=A0AAD4AEZ1_9GAMM|nr:ParB N-terminal domain-containing protein [Pseudoalteromonas citrea]KAF7764710.1 chromosome partitioning protein, ParB family [Pseudoalteromonas citrea]